MPTPMKVSTLPDVTSTSQDQPTFNSLPWAPKAVAFRDNRDKLSGKDYRHKSAGSAGLANGNYLK